MTDRWADSETRPDEATVARQLLDAIVRILRDIGPDGSGGVSFGALEDAQAALQCFDRFDNATDPLDQFQRREPRIAIPPVLAQAARLLEGELALLRDDGEDAPDADRLQAMRDAQMLLVRDDARICRFVPAMPTATVRLAVACCPRVEGPDWVAGDCMIAAAGAAVPMQRHYGADIRAWRTFPPRPGRGIHVWEGELAAEVGGLVWRGTWRRPILHELVDLEAGRPPWDDEVPPPRSAS